MMTAKSMVSKRPVLRYSVLFVFPPHSIFVQNLLFIYQTVICLISFFADAIAPGNSEILVRIALREAVFVLGFKKPSAINYSL